MIWNYNGQTYDGATVDLQGVNRQEVTVTISDETCSISKTFDYHFGMGFIGNRVYVSQVENLCEEIEVDGVNVEGEDLLTDVEITFIDANTNEFLQRTYTDSFGRFLFQRLDAGDYILRIIPTTEGTTIVTTKDCPDSQFDAEGNSEIISLGVGEIYLKGFGLLVK